jgi:hypothetical protein
MLHLTAKSTQFGKKTFTSWLIEAAGTVPIQRRKDFADGMINNDAAMAKLTQVRAFISHAKKSSLPIADLGDGRCCMPVPGGRE